MVLSPLDIHNKDFKKVFRGYAEEEVDDFLDKIVKDYENLYKENIELKEIVEKKDGNIGRYKDLEDTLKDTLVIAQQTAKDIKTNSQKEAELILEKAINEAELKMKQAKIEADVLFAEAQRESERLVYQSKNQAHDLVMEAKEKHNSVMSDYEKIVTEYTKFQAKFKALLQAQMEIISDKEPLTIDDPDFRPAEVAVANDEEDAGDEYNYKPVGFAFEEEVAD